MEEEEEESFEKDKHVALLLPTVDLGGEACSRRGGRASYVTNTYITYMTYMTYTTCTVPV